MPRWSVGANQQWQRQVSGRVPEGCFQFDAFASLSGPPTASAFACGSASATPPQGGQPQGLCRCAGGQGGGYWLVPPPHQPSPAARLLRLPLKGATAGPVKMGKGGEVAGIGWPPLRISLRLPARLLRLPLQGGVILKRLMQASRITPPLRGSRREGGARSRAGGGQPRRPIEPEGGKRGVPSSRRGQTPRPASDYQRQGQRGVGVAPISQSR